MRARLLLVVGTLLCAGAAAGCAPSSSPSSPPSASPVLGSGAVPVLEPPAARASQAARADQGTPAYQRDSGANPGVIGLELSGIGSSLLPPDSPTDKPYNSNCHLLVDAGFSGKCVTVDAPSGTVAGVVEVETAANGRATGGLASRANGPSQEPRLEERDLVWHRVGPRWELDLVHVFENPGQASQVWGDDVERDGDPKLVFVMPSARAGFGTELDLVEGSGAVTLYRFLGEGFANVPDAGGLVTYVPGWTEQRGPANEFDQTLIGYSQGSWRVFSQQYVPDKAALAQHRAAFWDSEAAPAR